MIKKCTLVIIALLSVVPVFAAAPLITDDTGTMGRGNIQIEGDYTGGVTGQYPGQQIAATLTYGVVETIDVMLSLPYNWHTIPWEGSSLMAFDKFGDAVFQCKWRFLESKSSGFCFALKPGVSFPSGNEADGFGTGKICEGVMLLVTKEWEHGACYCNIGYNHNTFNMELDDETLQHNLWHASIAAVVNMTNSLKGAGDIGVDTNTVRAYSANPVYVLGGLIYRVTDNLDLDFGVKGRLNNAAPPATVLAGFSRRF
ncbi:MAG: transporter [Chlorobium sp.]